METETTKTVTVQVDDLLSFRQFSKKTADEAIDVRVNFFLWSCKTTDFFLYSMTKTSDEPQVLAKFKKISCQTSAVSRN